METRSEILQGTLDLMVLQTLDAIGPLHGYGIARRIEQVSECRRRKSGHDLFVSDPLGVRRDFILRATANAGDRHSGGARRVARKCASAHHVRDAASRRCWADHWFGRIAGFDALVVFVIVRSELV